MTEISQVNKLQNTNINSSSGSLQVNQTQFIELFVAQLNRQDPLAPMDTNQMLTQLSQISSVESLNSIDEQIIGLTNSLEQSRMFGASQLIGKEIQVNSNKVNLVHNGDIKGEAVIPVNASDVLIRLYDAAGGLVESQSLGSRNAGSVQFSLKDVNSGDYMITATAVSGDQAFAAGVELQAKVLGIKNGVGGGSLQLDGIGSFPLSAVTMIKE